MRFANLLAMAGLFISLIGVANAADDPPAPPADFKIVARYGPGYSDWHSWQVTITADGKVTQHIGKGGRGGGEESDKEAKLSKDDLAALAGKVKDAEFFKLKEQYKGKVTDMATLILEITTDKKTHKVLLYAPSFLTDMDDQKAADRFLGIWSDVLKKVPAPNEKQTPDMYKQGNFRKPKKDDK
jgi:Domain of unknown function (DUF6438)